VTEQLAEFVVDARYEDLPSIGVHRVKERLLDSFGTQFAGMGVPTGQRMATWVEALGASGTSSVVGGGFTTAAPLAALVNATAGHALDFDDSSMFSSHPSNPLTAAILAVGESQDISGQDAILAFMVGWEVICQTNAPCQQPEGHVMLLRGWHNQGFQPALGIAAITSKLMGLDTLQTRMAIGNAASTMSGLHKNAGSDTKPFHAGNPALHGIMAAELVAGGFTANPDILDGEWGVARMLGLDVGEAEKILDGLGSWDLARNGSWIKVNACNGGTQWAMAVMQSILAKHPAGPQDIESIEVHLSRLLIDELHQHKPQTGLQAKFSIEYAVTTIVLDGRGGVRQFTDPMVLRPEAQDLMARVRYVVLEGELWKGTRVIVEFKDGQTIDESATTAHGQPADPLTEAEIAEKFHDCAAGMLPEPQRNAIAEMCWNLESLDTMRQMGDIVRTAPT
jgi:2-methylcitrate dehydratase PrpD